MTGATRPGLTIEFADADLAALRRFWHWLLGDSPRPLFATALGDVFLADDAGRVLWLNIGGLELVAVAGSLGEFGAALADPETIDYWLGPALVGRLRDAGKPLAPGECYSYVTLPICGGEFAPSNFTVYPLAHHLAVWGPFCEYARDLPDGTAFEIAVMD